MEGEQVPTTKGLLRLSVMLKNVTFQGASIGEAVIGVTSTAEYTDQVALKLLGMHESAVKELYGLVKPVLEEWVAKEVSELKGE